MPDSNSSKIANQDGHSHDRLPRSSGSGLTRRDFLYSGAKLAGGATVSSIFYALWAKSVYGQTGTLQACDYGPLSAVNDATTGLPLLKLPAGFRYVSGGWTGDLMSDGNPTPRNHDGMAVVGTSGSKIKMIRNHEIVPGSGGIVFQNPNPAIVYDSSAKAGTTTIEFDGKQGRWLSTKPTLAGTATNCAGGPTPWGSWLTCEEVITDLGKPHGYIFEVPGSRSAHPVPLTAMGRFKHEAVAVDSRDGVVYETEDDTGQSGFYRFTPNKPYRTFGLEAGGRLEMLKVVGVSAADLRQPTMGQEFDVEWVTIANPNTPRDGSGASGPFAQGLALGAARFRRLEGCFYGNNCIYFTDTEGGAPASDSGISEGAVWCYDASARTLTAIFVSPAKATANNPDNVTVSPRGGILLCEDSGELPTRLLSLSPSGDIFPFAENNVNIPSGVPGRPAISAGDYRTAEWAGVTYDRSGKWLFANVQSPGVSFAITGPWGNGCL